MIKILNCYGPAVELSRPDHRVARQHPRYLVEVLHMHSDHDYIYLFAASLNYSAHLIQRIFYILATTLTPSRKGKDRGLIHN